MNTFILGIAIGFVAAIAIDVYFPAAFQKTKMAGAGVVGAVALFWEKMPWTG